MAMPPPSPPRPLPPPSIGKQVEALVSDRDRVPAYCRLLHLQRSCADDPSAAAALAAASSPLLHLLLRDSHLVGPGDEAVAASALKCLGFALYHPALVSTISEGMARSILDSLVQLIMTTRMKQLEVLVIEDRAISLLTAVVHALDNPFGSLSTTFEAIQAIMKLAGQISTRMRDMSSIWAPPIYRRLLSTDKPEGDMAERCLLRVLSIVSPPHSLLCEIPFELLRSSHLVSQFRSSSIVERKLILDQSLVLVTEVVGVAVYLAVASDLEHKLLSCMMDMLHDALNKVRAVKSWGWFISLLGSTALNKRLLLNKMLKIPEKLFGDLDPQVQIATLVAWRNLVDAFILSQVKEFNKMDSVIMVQEERLFPLMESKRYSDQYGRAQIKAIRLIMVPLCGIMSRNGNIGVLSSCMSTWHYLLHKLGLFVNSSPILEIAFGPILKIIFSTIPDSENMQLWTFCINLFHNFVSSKIRQTDLPEEDLFIRLNGTSLPQCCTHLKNLLDAQPVRWLPWDISCLDFQLEILSKLVNPGLLENMNSEIMIVLMDSAIQIFRLLLRGIELEFKLSSVCDDVVHICISNVCKFVKTACGNLAQGQNGKKCNVVLQFSLQFVKAATKELDPSLLASASCKIYLDIEYMKDLECFEPYPQILHLGSRPLAYMDMVSPAVYLTTLSLSMVAQFATELSQEDAEHLALISCSGDLLENLSVVFSFMCLQIMKPTDNKSKIKWLMIWNKTAKGLKEQILTHLKFQPRSGYDVACQFLCYPFLVFVSPEKMSILSNAENSSESHFSLAQEDIKAELAIEVYKSLNTYASAIACNFFWRGFCEHLVKVIDVVSVQANNEYCFDKRFENIAMLSSLGEVAIHVLENTQVSDFTNQGPKKAGKEAATCGQSNLTASSLELVSRFMRLSILALKANPHAQHHVTKRVFGSLRSFVEHLVLKKDIFLLLQVISDALSQWLSLSSTLYFEMQHGQTVHQLEKLWLQILGCLKRSQLITDVSFLKMQEPIFQIALNHSHHPISDATTSVWKAATGARTISRYRQYSVSELDELLANGERIVQGFSNDAIAREELDISSRFTMATSEKIKLASDASREELQKNGRSVKMSMCSRRLKITKYPIKGKEHRASVIDQGCSNSRLNTSISSPYFIERKGCRKPELIMEMLTRKR